MKSKKSPNPIRKLYTGDNLAIMRGLEDESVDLIYLDPPFNSKRIYEGNLDEEMGKQSFKDIWTMSDINKDDLWALRAFAPKVFNLIKVLSESHGESWQAYLTFMAVRLDEMHRILKPTGSIYLHCDWHMNAPLRLLMDILFGKGNFRNDIVWCYTAPANIKSHFPRKHDNILFYSKSEEVCFNYNAVRVKHKRQHLSAGATGMAGGKRSIAEIRQKEEEALKVGKIVEDWWSDIGSGSHVPKKERTGWTTQKPLVLLERIIKASSNKGDLVLDPFCGCATACVAAERLGRQWIGIDQHPAAAGIMEKRIKDDTKLAPEWAGVECIDTIRKSKNLPRRKGVREINKSDPEVKKAFYERQDGKCKSGKWCLAGGEMNIRLMDYDRIDPRKRGGYYTPDNVQLLCGACNAAKGEKTWTEFIGDQKQQAADDILGDKDVPR